MTDRRERWFNRSLEQWLADTIAEARRDRISLQQVYGALSSDFEIQEEELGTVLSFVLEQIFVSGVVPVIQGIDGRITEDTAFTGSAATMACEVIRAVRDDPELATFSGIWLATPG